MKRLSREDALLLVTLRKAGHEAVARKRRLGQYAVIWRDGAPAFIGPNPPAVPQGYARSAAKARRTGAGERGAGRAR